MSDLVQDAEKAMQGGGGGQQQATGGSGGGQDQTLNEGVDKIASEEGVPSAMDGAINKEVDSEAGKML